MDYQIEQFGEKHLPMRETFFETLNNLILSPTLGEKETMHVLSQMENQGSLVFVAVSDAGIVGSITLLLEHKLTKGGCIAGHIEEVVVRKGFEGKGIAGALMKKAIEIAKEKGCYKVILDCEENLVPFYEKFGFKHDGAFMITRM